MSLHQGDIVRYASGLWRVDYVNECRARIIPLARRHVVVGDREFDSEQRGVNISPNSPLPVITDLDRARDELELAAAEAELASARAALAREQAAAAAPASKPRRHEPAPSPAKVGRAAPAAATAAPAGMGWRLGGPTALPTFEPGSLKELVVTVLAARPGGSFTKDVATRLAEYATPGAVAACLDRLWKAGYIIK